MSYAGWQKGFIVRGVRRARSRRIEAAEEKLRISDYFEQDVQARVHTLTHKQVTFFFNFYFIFYFIFYFFSAAILAIADGVFQASKGFS
jgi:hypothetical protein